MASGAIGEFFAEEGVPEEIPGMAAHRDILQGSYEFRLLPQVAALLLLLLGDSRPQENKEERKEVRTLMHMPT